VQAKAAGKEHLVFEDFNLFRETFNLDEMHGFRFIGWFSYYAGLCYFFENDLPFLSLEHNKAFLRSPDAMFFALQFTGKLQFEII
jgi:hypothetical protein